MGAVNILPGISNRAGEQAEKLLEFLIILSENLPNETNFCPTWGLCSPLPPPPTIMAMVEGLLCRDNFLTVVC